MPMIPKMRKNWFHYSYRPFLSHLICDSDASDALTKTPKQRILWSPFSKCDAVQSGIYLSTFRGDMLVTYFLLKTEAAGESETLTYIYRTSPHHVPEHHSLNIGMLSAGIAQSLSVAYRGGGFGVFKHPPPEIPKISVESSIAQARRTGVSISFCSSLCSPTVVIY